MIALPNRDTLILTGSRDVENLKLLAQETDAEMRGPRSSCGVPLVLSEGAYTPFVPQPGDPAYAELKRHYLTMVGTLYHEQKDILEAMHEKTGEDIFVASYGSIENNEQERILSWSSWAPGVLTLLPEADVVALSEPEPEREPGIKPKSFFPAWRDLKEIAGSLMKPTDLYPVRYKVSEYPGPALLQQLAARSVM